MANTSEQIPPETLEEWAVRRAIDYFFPDPKAAESVFIDYQTGFMKKSEGERIDRLARSFMQLTEEHAALAFAASKRGATDAISEELYQVGEAIRNLHTKQQ
jgi:hypothetical protein